MDKLRAITLFVRLAELGSFTKVAEETGSAKSLVSKEISRLEEEVGARLIHRSTRNIQLTDIGEGYLKRCKRLLASIEDSESYVQDMQSRPRGKLKLNAPMALGITDLGGAFAEFMATFPDVELDIHLSDEPVVLVEHGYDLGLRAASRQFDSPYIGKKICEFKYHICASPEYLKKHGVPETPNELARRNCFIYSYFRGGDEWPVGDGVNVSGSLRVNSTIFMREVVLRGHGIGFIPEFIVSDQIKSGALVKILEDYPLPELSLLALYPEREFVPPKVTHCIEFLKLWFNRNYA